MLCLFFSIKKGTRIAPSCSSLAPTFANRHNNIMKICAACSQELPRENFSKKQWQAKQRRRCKDCIAVNREVASVEAPDNLAEAPANDNDPTIMSSADGEGASSWSDEALFKQPPPRKECPNAAYLCHQMGRRINTNRAVEKLCAVDVFMPLV